MRVHVHDELRRQSLRSIVRLLGLGRFGPRDAVDGPVVSFMARKAVAMPAAVWKKRRRLMPSRFAMCAPISLMRASNSCCLGVCSAGMNSSLDTDCTGIGDGNSDSAEESLFSSSGDSMLMIPPVVGALQGGALGSFCHTIGAACTALVGMVGREPTSLPDPDSRHANASSRIGLVGRCDQCADRDRLCDENAPDTAMPGAGLTTTERGAASPDQRTLPAFQAFSSVS
jgi:hypothetical protein